MPRRCRACFEITPSIEVSKCPHCGVSFKPPARPSPFRSTRPRTSPIGLSPTLSSWFLSIRETPVSSHPKASCAYTILCAKYLNSLKWQEAYFDHRFDYCYCNTCYPSSSSDTSERGGAVYVLPRGWCRFGLHVDQVRSVVDSIWSDWVVTYHGTTPIAAQSIVAHRQFLVPGDKCLDGSSIGIREGHIPGKNQIYTSPTIAYSSLPAYCPQQNFRSPSTKNQHKAYIVLQCRQKPGAFTVQKETVGAGSRQLCPFIPNDRIEIYTTVRAAVVPYGLLIRVT